MPSILRVEGSWPGPLTITAGWFKARARPWNESVPDPMVRLDRGGAEFLSSVTDRLEDLGAVGVYSPALYRGATRVWRRAGFEDHATLDVMERPMDGVAVAGNHDGIGIDTDPDWDEMLTIDRSAFEGFWGMSRLGLEEAHTTNKSTALLVAHAGDRLAGYAIVGSQWGTVYLHRIAVRPEESGKGLGAGLIKAAINWGNRTGATTMILNVRSENTRASRLYERLGFIGTGTSLQVLRHQPGSC
ncbi:MAG: GNAT family N-acetyltransferase [Acidimicrobiia bacterium]